MNLQERIGKAIVYLRKKKGLSQENFANEAGVDRRYMSDIENGKRNLSIDVIERIATYLHIELSEFFKIAETIEEEPLTLESLKEALCNKDFENTIVFENPDYITAVVGVTEDGRVVYSFEKMVDFLVETDGMDYEEANDFVCYNTLRALPCQGEKAPVVIYGFI